MTHLWLPFLMQTRAWHAWLTVYYDLSKASRWCIRHSSTHLLLCVQTSACDARLTAFYGLSVATRCWIKGRRSYIHMLLPMQTFIHSHAAAYADKCV